jgi:dCMP deaminase
MYQALSNISNTSKYIVRNAPKRPSFPQMFMDTCKLWAKRSTCLRLQTAAILVKNNNIISIGYNGVPNHLRHCGEFWDDFYKCAKQINLVKPDDELVDFYRDTTTNLRYSDELLADMSTFDEFIESDTFGILHHYWSDKNELHAELNAILQAECSLKDTTLYSLYSPCRQCAKSIISAKISKVVYHEEYSRDIEGLALLKKCGIGVEQL